MPTSRMNGTFEVLSPRIARLTISQPVSSFGLTVDPRLRKHQLGFRDGPLYELEQPFSPDDGWEIVPRPLGRLVEELWIDDPHNDLEERCAAWASGSRATRGHGLLGLLPLGTYLLVRSPRRPIETGRILLGNKFVAARPSMRVLRDDKPVYALVTGPQPRSSPSLDQPLLGLVVLNYVGDSWMHGVLFFEFAAPVADASVGDGELLLIIPVEGEMIFDNMGFFSAADEEVSRMRWRDEFSGGFARWCAGETAEILRAEAPVDGN